MTIDFAMRIGVRNEMALHRWEMDGSRVVFMVKVVSDDFLFIANG